MNIQELEYKHFIIPDQAYRSSTQHTKLSVEFAIEQLGHIIYDTRHTSTYDMTKDVMIRIQELKQYLDEE